MKRIVHFVLPLAIVMFFAIPATAQHQYRLEFFGAGNFAMDKDFEITFPQSTVAMTGNHDFLPGAAGGVRLGVDGTGHWGQDLSYSFGNNASRIINETNGATFAFTNRIHQISYNALWYPTGLGDRKWTPFLTAGFGATLYRLGPQAINEALDPNQAGLGRVQSDNIFAFNAGAGVQFRINKVYGFRVDFRDFMTRAVRYGLPNQSEDPNATVFPVSGIFHQFQISFAFVYYF